MLYLEPTRWVSLTSDKLGKEENTEYFYSNVLFIKQQAEVYILTHPKYFNAIEM